jgi:hypothetical protein
MIAQTSADDFGARRAMSHVAHGTSERNCPVGRNGRAPLLLAQARGRVRRGGRGGSGENDQRNEKLGGAGHAAS